MAAYAVRELGLDVRATTLERFGTDDQFDAVAMLQVVDDVEDIRLSFERISALTKAGGWCLIEFGNRASLTARILGSEARERDKLGDADAEFSSTATTSPRAHRRSIMSRLTGPPARRFSSTTEPVPSLRMSFTAILHVPSLAVILTNTLESVSRWPFMIQTHKRPFPILGHPPRRRPRTGTSDSPLGSPSQMNANRKVSADAGKNAVPT
jgi:hypothetical protein